MKRILIGDLCDFRYGKALKKENRNEGSIPVYGSNGIVGYHDKALVEKKTIVVGRKGSIGEVHIANVPSWPIDTTYYVEFKVQDISIEWFFRLLKTLHLNELNRSVAVPGLNRDDVYRIKINLPAPDDQFRIAKLLGSVETMIAKRKESLRLQDELLKGIFLEMFGDPIRNEKGWETSTIEGLCKDIIDCPHSTPIYSDEITDYFCVRSSDIIDGYLDLSRTYQVVQQVYNERIKRYTPKTGDIIYSREGGRLGNAARILGTEKICLGQRMMLFEVNSKNRSEFLWALLESTSFKFKLQSLVGGGAAPRVNIKDLKKIVIIKPPERKQRDFSKIIKKIDGIKSHYLRSLNGIENLYGALSQKAFKGELDLRRIPLDLEPRNTLTTRKEDSVYSVVEKEKDETLQISGATMSDPVAREQWLQKFFDASVAEYIGPSLSADDLWLMVASKAFDYMDDQSPPLGAADYNKLKNWLFDLLKGGRVEQRFNEDTNRMELILR